MSHKIDPKEFEEVFREVLVAALHEEGAVQIEGLGAFRKVHRGSREFLDVRGKVLMLPPEDRIEFEVESLAEMGNREEIGKQMEESRAELGKQMENQVEKEEQREKEEPL